MHRFSTLLATLALISCGSVPGVLSEKEFSRKYAEEVCDRTFDCDEEAADDFWGSEDDCAKETRKDLKASYDKECSFDAPTARECLQSFKELSCNAHYELIQDHVELCETIWECGE